MFDLEEEKYTFPNDLKQVNDFKLGCDVMYGLSVVGCLGVVCFGAYKLVNWLISYGYLKG